jgi:hypothetical protein
MISEDVEGNKSLWERQDKEEMIEYLWLCFPNFTTSQKWFEDLHILRIF